MAKHKSNGKNGSPLKGNQNQSINVAPNPNIPNTPAPSARNGMKRRTKDDIKNTILGTDPTRDYHSTRYSYFGELFVTNLPLWRLWTARMMLTSDSVVDFSFAVRDAALAAADVVVTGPNPRVNQWVQDQWNYLWDHQRPKLIAAKKYGFSALQVLFKVRKEDGLIHIDGLKDFAPEDARALEISGNKLCGMKVKGKPLYNPQALWLKFGAEFGNQYGVAITRKQYPSWYEKWMDHGAKRLQQLRMVKDAYIGDIFWYPPNLKVDLPDGTAISWKDLLRETAEHRLSGGAMTLPKLYDSNGKELTAYTPPQNIGGATEIFNWVDYCDDGIFKAAGVPLETFEAPTTGSGYSGRSIPMILLFSNCTSELVDIVQQVDEQVLRPLAWLNFGQDPDYDITPKSLVESLSDDVGGGAMGGPIGGASEGAAPPQQAPPQMPQGTVPPNVQFGEAVHAPPGGVTIHGVEFKGGEFIPSEVIDNLHPDDRSTLLAGAHARQSKATPDKYKPKDETEQAKDKHLVAAKGGDQDAMEKVFELYGDAIKHLAHKYSKGSPQKFEDLVSVGNVALMKSIQGYDPSKTRFITYLWKALQTSMLRHLDKGKKFAQVPEEEEGKQVEAVDTSAEAPEQGMVQDQQHAKLTEALQGLSDKHKEVVTRHIMNGERMQDIGDSWGVSKMRVSQVLAQALTKLRDVLDEEQFSELVKGGLADGMQPDSFDQEALQAGIKVEMEHTDNEEVAKEIAMDHLKEDPKYYTKLKKMEGNTQHTEGPHKYCSTQFNLPPDLAQMVLTMGLMIDPNDLAGDGVEYEPHITVLYGLHPEAEGMIVGPVTGMSPIAVQLGECSVFHADMSKPTEQGLHDVVKIEVHSDSLHKLHNELKKLPHTCTYPDYKPHVTIAYVKPGMGTMYAERFNLLKDKVAVFDRLIFSNCERKKISIPLQGQAQFTEGNTEGECSFPFGLSHSGLSIQFESADSSKHVHAPPGGITINGVFYHGGEFIPKHVLEGLTPDEKKELEFKKTQPPSSEGKWPLTHVSNLGGSTGAALVSLANNQLAVKKYGKDEGHVENEAHTNKIYNLLGVKAPKSSLYKDENGKTYMLSEHIDGVGLHNLPYQQRQEAYKKLREHFVADALLANWDVIGLSYDNILVDKEGNVWRVDNGGSMSYRAKGSPKGGLWNASLGELDSMRTQGTAGSVFGAVTSADIKKQAQEILKHKDKLKSYSNDKILHARLDKLEELYGEQPVSTEEIPEGASFLGATFNERLTNVQATLSKYGVKVTPLVLKRIALLNNGKDDSKLLTPKNIPVTAFNALKLAYPDKKVRTLGVGDKLKQQLATLGIASDSTVWNSAITADEKATAQENFSKGLITKKLNDQIQALPTKIGKPQNKAKFSGEFTAPHFNRADLTKGQALPHKIELGNKEKVVDEQLIWGTKYGSKSKEISYFKSSGKALRIAEEKGLDQFQHGSRTLSTKAFREVLDKAPNYEGIVYRGVGHVTPGTEAYAALTTIGSTVEFNCSAHASRNPTESIDSFSGSECLYRMAVKTAANIDNVHGFGDEMEVVPKKGTKYKVVGYYHNVPYKGSSYHSKIKFLVDLEEVEEAHPEKHFAYGFNEDPEQPVPQGDDEQYDRKDRFVERDPDWAFTFRHSEDDGVGEYMPEEPDIQFDEQAMQFIELDAYLTKLRAMIGKGTELAVDKVKLLGTGLNRLKSYTNATLYDLATEIQGQIAKLAPYLANALTMDGFLSSVAGYTGTLQATPKQVLPLLLQAPVGSLVSYKSVPSQEGVGTAQLPTLEEVLFPSQEPAITEVHLPALQAAVHTLDAAPVATGKTYVETAKKVRDGSFAITAEMTDKAVEDVKQELTKAIVEGKSQAEFIDTVKERLTVEGSPLSPPHLENVFRTNVMAAYSNAQHKAVQDTMVVDAFPYAGYGATHDARVREEHKDLEGLGLNGTNIYRADDPTFITFRPPWSYNCRCSWYPVTIEQAAKRGVVEAQQWVDRAKALAKENGGTFYQYLNQTKPTEPKFVKPPSFKPDPNFKREL